jgi:hypothetical protein
VSTIMGKIGARTALRRVDFDPAATINVPVLFFRGIPSIAAFEDRAGCGARQWHRVGAPGGAGSYVIGPARPKAATPGDRGPAVARPEPRWVRDPAAIRRVAPPGAPSPLSRGTEKGIGRARQPEKSEVAGQRSVVLPGVARRARPGLCGLFDK